MVRLTSWNCLICTEQPVLIAGSHVNASSSLSRTRSPQQSSDQSGEIDA